MRRGMSQVGRERKPDEIYCINTWRYPYECAKEAVEVPFVHPSECPE